LGPPLRWRVLLVVLFPDALGLRMACTLRHSSWLPDYRDFFAALPDRTGVRGGWI